MTLVSLWIWRGFLREMLAPAETSPRTIFIDRGKGKIICIFTHKNKKRDQFDQSFAI